MAALAIGLGGCATYQAKPLGDRVTLFQNYADIAVERKNLPLPEMAAHPFNAHGRLDMDDVAILAVVNNPDLKVARANAQVLHAQAFAAGLLPDPQFSLTRDFPQNPQAGSSSAFNLNLLEDINALIRRHFGSKAGKYNARKTDLNLLWQEWQVVTKARTLYIQVVKGRQLMRVLQKNRVLFADRYRRTQIALDRGLLTLNAVIPHLAALQDIDKQIRNLERQQNINRHSLNALLGLAPEAPVPLREDVLPPALDETGLLARLSGLPRRRPDLLALQYGYQAEDQRYRAAILGQFPIFNIGFTRARDTGGIYTNGFGVTLNLPIFSGNRGNVAIEEATRQKLHDEYQNRLNAAYSDVHRILAEQRINARQLHDVEQGIVELSRVVAKADEAFRARNIDALSFVSLQASLLSKQIEKLNLEQSILEQRVVLQALVGGELPSTKD